MTESAGGATATSPPTAARKKKTTFSWCLKAPFRLLRRARDIYVKSLGGCAGAGGGARGGGFTAGVVALMPRARSRSAFGQSNRYGSGEDDFKDLVRASSKGRAAAAAAPAVVARCQSLPAIERIEEEEGEEEVYERSVSCVVVVPPAAAAAAAAAAAGGGGRLVRR